ETEITQLEVGEALISFLDAKGTPGVVERAYVCPPQGQIGPITPEERRKVMATSLVAGVYDRAIDRESAYERLKTRSQSTQGPANEVRTAAPHASSQTGQTGGITGELESVLLGSVGPRGGRREGIIEAMVKSGARSIGSQIGGQIVRGVLGSMLGGSGGRRR
ncbi:MAG: helicase HerA-like domain-containing protein, partial [Bryobacteraceae bacterium]